MKFKQTVLALILTSCSLVFSETLEEVSWGKNSPLLVLPAIFSITNASSPNGFNSIGFQMAEAFKCAVQQLNAAQIIPGLTIKAQVADAGSDLLTPGKIAAFATRYLQNDKFYTYVFAGGNNYADASTANVLLKARAVSLVQFFHGGSNIAEGGDNPITTE